MKEEVVETKMFRSRCRERSCRPHLMLACEKQGRSDSDSELVRTIPKLASFYKQGQAHSKFDSSTPATFPF